MRNCNVLRGPSRAYSEPPVKRSGGNRCSHTHAAAMDTEDCAGAPTMVTRQRKFTVDQTDSDEDQPEANTKTKLQVLDHAATTRRRKNMTQSDAKPLM